jgi:hypothetical protein
MVNSSILLGISLSNIFIISVIYEQIYNFFNIYMTKDLPIYKITIDPEYSDGEDLGIEQIAFTSQPAIKVKGMAFEQAQRMVFADDLKYRITAPAMIPMEIYRKDNEQGEYYVQFTEETIAKIHEKFMSDLRNRDLFNLEHDTSKTVPAYILETWVVDNPKQDKAFSTFGIDVPKGTLMVTAQITDKEYYAELVANDQIGFSIEGFLGLKLSNQLNKYNMNKLPDGEHLIDGKIYVVVDGEITEIKDAPIEEVAMEEVALEETVVEEEAPMVEDAVEEEMAVDPALDSEAILAIVTPILEEREKAIIALIADLRNQMEEMMVGESEVEATDNKTKMSMHDKFSAVSKFLNTNN